MEHTYHGTAMMKFVTSNGAVAYGLPREASCTSQVRKRCFAAAVGGIAMVRVFSYALCESIEPTDADDRNFAAEQVNRPVVTDARRSGGVVNYDFANGLRAKTVARIRFFNCHIKELGQDS